MHTNTWREPVILWYYSTEFVEIKHVTRLRIVLVLVDESPRLRLLAQHHNSRVVLVFIPELASFSHLAQLQEAGAGAPERHFEFQGPRRLIFDPAIGEMDHRMAGGRNFLVMGHHDDCQSPFAVQFA
jgi:hypothetical protein